MVDGSSRRRALQWPYQSHEKYEVLLREAAHIWYAGKGIQTQPKYPYILSEWSSWPKNIIVPEVVTYIAGQREQCQAERKPFPLHKFVHHGLSSQALLFNLIGPMVVRHDLAPLLTALAAAGVTWPAGDATATFELADRTVFNEDTGQPTSIDLVLEGNKASHPLFVECKFVEREFGGCSVFARGDCEGRNPVGNLSECYLHFLGRRYWDRLDQHGFLDTPLFSSAICPLATYYQFFREVLFALHKSGYFVLLYDERNPTFVRGGSSSGRGLLPFLLSTLPETAQPHVKSLTIQSLFEAIVEGGRQSDWTDDFAEKYRLPRGR